MCASQLVLALVLLNAVPAAAGGPPPRIKSADFPSVSRRAVFFEERINAADPVIRKRVLTEVGYFFDVPEPEYVAFLRRMLRDPDPVVCGRALRKLHGMFVPVGVKDLPQKFTTLHEDQVIDLADKKTVPGLLKACRGGPGDSTQAAYVLGLLRHKAAIADIRKLADIPGGNIYGRSTAARALVDCGAADVARPILDDLVNSQLALYAAGLGTPQNPGQAMRSPYYAAIGCRALIHLGPDGRKVGLERLITVVAHMEASQDVNDQAHLPAVRQVLAAETGRYFLSAAQARKWYRAQYQK